MCCVCVCGCVLCVVCVCVCSVYACVCCMCVVCVVHEECCIGQHMYLTCMHVCARIYNVIGYLH